MYFQQSDITRYLLVFIIQPIISSLLLFIMYKILKRNRTIHSITLSLFYIIVAVAFFCNVLYVIAAIFNSQLITYIIFYLTSYLIIYSPIFLIIFIKMLLKVEEKLSIKKELLYALIYGIICIYIFIFPKGITISSATDWRPLYSIEFMIFSFFILTFIVVLPLGYYSFKLYKTLESEILKKKYKFFVIGSLGFVGGIYGIILYNTWQEPIFRFFWSIGAIFLSVITLSLIYYGIGKNL